MSATFLWICNNGFPRLVPDAAVALMENFPFSLGQYSACNGLVVLICGPRCRGLNAPMTRSGMRRRQSSFLAQKKRALRRRKMLLTPPVSAGLGRLIKNAQFVFGCEIPPLRR